MSKIDELKDNINKDFITFKDYMREVYPYSEYIHSMVELWDWYNNHMEEEFNKKLEKYHAYCKFDYQNKKVTVYIKDLSGLNEKDFQLMTLKFYLRTDIKRMNHNSYKIVNGFIFERDDINV